LWCIKHLKKICITTFTLLQDKYHKTQIKKELQEKKESIINPKADDTAHTDEDYQEVIEAAIGENESSEPDTSTQVLSFPDKRKNSTVENRAGEGGSIPNSSTSSLPEEPLHHAATKETAEPTVAQPSFLNEKTKKQLDRISVEANFLKNEGKFEEYEKKIIEGLALDPTNLELTKMLADLYFTLGSHKKALSLLKKIIERDPEDHKSLRQIGEIYFINGDNQTAELLVEKAINLKPDSPKYNLSLVEIYYNTDRVNDAIACMEKIIKLRPANTNYLLTLAELYEEINDITNAKKHYFNILEFEPSNEKAKKKLKQYSE
jgi:tetratricopeptide (TPR) repeat protein